MARDWVRGLHMDNVDIHEGALARQTDVIRIDGVLVTFITESGVLRYQLVSFDHETHWFRGVIVRPTVFPEELIGS